MMKKQQSIYELNRIQQYIMQMRPILRKRALFSDGTEDYRSPAEPKAGELVTIRFRTARDNVDAVWLCTEQKKYFMETLLEILSDLVPGVQFEGRTDLVESGDLDSLKILNLISDISDEFDVTIPVGEVVPENFDSPEAIMALINKLQK